MHIDARVVCVAFYEHRQPDTLSFGEGTMQMNRTIGFIQPWPLLRIAAYLPEDHRREIADYLDLVWIRDDRFPKYGYEK